MGSSVALLLLESMGLPTGLWTVVTAFATLSVGFLYVVRQMPRWASLGVFSLETILPLVGSWMTADTLAALGRPFSPFTSVKIVALVVAILCPSLALGTVLIGVAVALPIAQTLQWTASIRSHLPQLEPIQSVAVALFAVPFLFVRRRHAALGEQVARARAERLWLERLVRLALLVRNLTRLPVETTRNALTLMRARNAAPSLDRMESAIARLELLNETIAPLARVMPGELAAAHPDAIPQLQKELMDSRQMEPKETRPMRSGEGEARRAVTLNSALGVSATILLLALYRITGHPTWPTVIMGVPSLVCLSTALALSRRSDRFYQALFAIQAMFSIAFVLVADADLAERGPYDAFIYMKFVLLIVAFLAPSGRLGAALIGVATLAAVVETYLWFSPVQRSRMPLLEPWLTVLIGLTAFGVLAARRQDAATVRELVRASAERAWMSRVARLALSVRDFANTPLQVLWLDLELLRQTHAEPELAEVEASLARLQRLNETLLPLYASIEMSDHIMSFDALENIAAEVQETLRDSKSHVPGQLSRTRSEPRTTP
jgi:hypothetical protein